MSVEVGITVNIETDYTSENIEITRGDYDEVILTLNGDSEIELNDKDLDVLIKALVFFRDRRDEKVLDTGLSVPDDTHVAFP